MKILILSCNTGGGHNSAAMAIKEYFDSREIFCEIKDALAFDSQLKSDIISKGHVLLYKRAPKLFGFGYLYAEKHPAKPGRTSMIYAIVKRGAKALCEYLKENEIDAVISTHVFASMMLTEIRKNQLLDIKSYYASTDYTCHPGVEEIDVDAYFIAHQNLSPEYLKLGVAEEKLIPVGIPIKRAFYHSLSKEKAKKLLGLPLDKKVVLLMCGSMGCGPIYKLGKKVLNNLPQNAVLVVVCGSNEKLVKKFKKIQSDQMHVVGFTDKMNLYMDASNVIITKPGGLSSTEAATKSIPMVLMNIVAGCETRNLDFLLNNGFAVSADTLDGWVKETVDILENEEKENVLIDAMKKSFSIYAAGALGDHVISCIDKK